MAWRAGGILDSLAISMLTPCFVSRNPAADTACVGSEGADKISSIVCRVRLRADDDDERFPGGSPSESSMALRLRFRLFFLVGWGGRESIIVVPVSQITVGTFSLGGGPRNVVEWWWWSMFFSWCGEGGGDLPAPGRPEAPSGPLPAPRGIPHCRCIRADFQSVDRGGGLA